MKPMKFWGIFLLLFANGWVTWLLDTEVFPTTFEVIGAGGPWVTYGLVGLVFTLINALVRPIVFLVSVPLRWITMGGISLALNAGLLWLAEQVINTFQIASVTMDITGILTYILIGLALSIVNSVLHWLI